MFLILSPNILQPTPEKRLDLRFVCRQAARNVRFSRCGFALHRKLSLHKKGFPGQHRSLIKGFRLVPVVQMDVQLGFGSGLEQVARM